MNIVPFNCHVFFYKPYWYMMIKMGTVSITIFLNNKEYNIYMSDATGCMAVISAIFDIYKSQSVSFIVVATNLKPFHLGTSRTKSLKFLFILLCMCSDLILDTLSFELHTLHAGVPTSSDALFLPFVQGM